MSAKTILLAVACIGLVSTGVAMPQNTEENGNEDVVEPICCRLPPDNYTEEMKACSLESSNPWENITSLASHFQCVMECVFKNANMLNANNELNYAAIKADMDTEATKYPEWTAIFKNAYNNCTASQENVPEDAICKSGAMEFSLCLGNSMAGKCPVSARVDSPQCAGKYYYSE